MEIMTPEEQEKVVAYLKKHHSEDPWLKQAEETNEESKEEFKVEEVEDYDFR